MTGAGSNGGSDSHEAMHSGSSNNISTLAVSAAPYLGILVLGIIGVWQRKSLSGFYQRLKFQRIRRK
jgi:hypothetical protein